MKKAFLLLVVLLLSNLKSFSQTGIVTDDSLVCFPIKYLSFIREDLTKGDQAKKELVELQKSYTTKESENKTLKTNLGLLNAEMVNYSTCQDSIERKNALISNYHMQIGKAKKGNKILTGIVLALTAAFFIK